MSLMPFNQGLNEDVTYFLRHQIELKRLKLDFFVTLRLGIYALISTLSCYLDLNVTLSAI